VELKPESQGTLPIPCLAPGQVTTFIFDSAPASLELPDQGRFELPAPGEPLGRTLSLMPRNTFAVGERIPITIHFGDEAVPASATFSAAFHPARNTRQIRVSRSPRPPAEAHRQAQLLEEENARLREENRQLRAERKEAPGLVGTILNGFIGPAGIAGKAGSNIITRETHAIRVFAVNTYRTPTQLVIHARFMNRGREEWAAVGSRLTGTTVTDAYVPWQERPTPPDDAGDVFVVVPAVEAPGAFKLTLWSKDGRTVTVGNITFP
jgi:uncharacterized protein (TIGR02268 family)